MTKHWKLMAILDGVASIVGFGRAAVHSPGTAQVLRQLDEDAEQALRGDWERVGRDLSKAVEKIAQT